MTHRFRNRSKVLAACSVVAFAMLPLWAGAQTTGQTTSQTSPSSAATAPQEYRLGPGDDLSVTFPYNAELNHDGLIGPDGRFALPVLGSLDLSGDTTAEAAAAITSALRTAGIVENAYTSLSIRRYGTNVYVGGQVHLPGVVALAAGMDPLQAILAAGGLTDQAKTGQVAILRRTPDNHARLITVDVKRYIRGQQTEAVLLQPRDIVFVPRSRIAEFDLWIDNYINKALPFSRGLNYSYGNYPVTTVVR